jgi:putative hemolysin
MEPFNDRPFVKIDVKKLIRSQENKIIRNIPNFLIYILRKIIHEKEINQAIELDKNFYGIDFIKRNINFLNIKIDTHGTENLPENGRFIFVCNHSLGGIDFYAAILSVYEIFPNIRVIANELLNGVYNIKDLFLPVNVFKKNGLEIKEAINLVLASEDKQLMTFPAGEVSRRHQGKIEDRDWNKSFIRNSIEYQRDVIPILIDSENSNFFYRVTGFRELLGLKIPLELILLPHELLKKRNKTIRVVIGKPISFNRFDNSKSEFDWAQTVKNEVYKLKQKYQ